MWRWRSRCSSDEDHDLFLGSLGTFPGALWGVHGISVDQEQNLYLAAVGRGGVLKFRPRQGANPAYVVGKHVYSAWK